MKQPLVAVAIVYGAGVVLGHFLAAPLLPSILIAFAFTGAAFCIERARPLLIPAAVFLFGWLNMSLRTAVISPHDLRTVLGDRAAQVSVRGRIIGTPAHRVVLRKGTETWHTLAEVAVDEIQGGSGP